MEITATRTYKINLDIDQDHFDELNEEGNLTELIDAITYTCDGGDLIGTMYLVHAVNNENSNVSHLAWSTDPDDWGSENVTHTVVDQVSFEVEDQGINAQDA